MYLFGENTGCIVHPMKKWTDLAKAKMKDLHMTQEKLAERLGVTQGAVAHWLSGRREPDLETIGRLLLELRLPPLQVALADGTPSGLDNNFEPGPESKGLIPLISWVQAGSWSEVVDLYAVGDAEDWLPCPSNHGPRCFALRVRGESMYDPHGRRSFQDGDIVYVDPDRQPENGTLVIAKLTDSQEATFKQLVIEGEKRYLKALNPSWPNRVMPINGDCAIVGVVFSKVELF